MRKLLFTTALAAMALSAGAASATVLTFDVSGGVTNHANIAQTYGDRVTASPDGAGHAYGIGVEGWTPNVVVDHGAAGEDPALWNTGYGNLTNVVFNDRDGDTTFTTTFTADTGFLVKLYSFDLASFINAGQTIQGFSIRDLGTNAVLASQGPTLISGATRNSFVFGTPLSANSLQLVVDLTGLGALSDDIGLDNVQFGQAAVQTGVVPEPSVWAMLLTGFFGAGAMLRARRRVLVAS